MNSPSSLDVQGNPIIWPDASIERLEGGYDTFSIHIREEVGSKKVVRGLGYIGIQMIGFWDDLIIESARLYSDHQFIKDCEMRVRSLPETGSEYRTSSANYLLELIFVDGCKLWVCAHEFQTDGGES